MSPNSLMAAPLALAVSAPPLPLPPPPPGGFRRRPALLGSLAAILSGPAIERAAATPHPDGELLGLCRRHTDLSLRAHALLTAMPECYGRDDELAYCALHVDPLEEEQQGLVDQMEGMRAKTVEGLLARIEMVVAEYGHLLDGEDDRGEQGMIAAILLDGMALAGGRA